MKILQTKIPGCFEIITKKHKDLRGFFVKVFHSPLYKKYGLNTSFNEDYYSISSKNVIRGLHFQLPPYDHIKLVYCLSGSVMDAVVDLRLGSPTYLQHLTIELSFDKGNILYIPKGLAHGFCTLSRSSTLVYKASTVYNSKKDTGIRWDSAGITWPKGKPKISDRDKKFITLKDFKSPFKYNKIL